jgi:hypothetical protein
MKIPNIRIFKTKARDHCGHIQEAGAGLPLEVDARSNKYYSA